jgi:pyruvate/2-oxoglutarate/acetoin dehydrogenase E1 component/TPP-dependent pyruvate/acetoin dehydrogenase alpha subunit
MNQVASDPKTAISKEEFKQEVLGDYKIAWQSRQASLIGRKEVLTGKAKFGIFGDGKEVAQLAMAKVFQNGDFRAGYYRDQTFMFAKGMSNIKAFFAQLYAHTNVEAEPSSAGRSMNGHFGTRLLDDDGHWKPQTSQPNSSADISPTAGHMPRLLGLAFASKLYRQNKDLHGFTDFSINGNEVAFGTIGNASTSEGHFWETINAAGVLQVPMCLSIWDDQYGISVHAKYQTTKENLSSILKGFQTDKEGKGYELFTVNGWEYPALIKTYQKAASICRKDHTPVIIHVTELTQPQGHSTSGSHERYKSKERLAWEAEHDCMAKMRSWIVENGIATAAELDQLEVEALDEVKHLKEAAWSEFKASMQTELSETISIITRLADRTANPVIAATANELSQGTDQMRREIMQAIGKALRFSIGDDSKERNQLIGHYVKLRKEYEDFYDSHQHSESDKSIKHISEVKAVYSNTSETLNGFEILQRFFNMALSRDPQLIAFGEDLGKIGDVNQGFAGLQEKYGELRVMDVGIREMTIIGQAIGASLRGLRPIAEIQYLDYLLYAIQVMSDDIATMQYRTKGGQKLPLIIRTRGHRLEGIWHSGSPMGMIINAVRGMNVLVPRNMVQAAGFYNTMLKSDEPALIIECLNGYRLKERLPDNLSDFTVSLGVPEILIEGTDITLVTYGSCCRIAEEAIKQLNEHNISVELIDVQSLLPFDVGYAILESLKKTNKLVCLDEDVPGGASAYMMQQVLEVQRGFEYLDAPPLTITAKEHRPAYGTDGDYFSKPNAENIFRELYGMMSDYAPVEFPALF